MFDSGDYENGHIKRLREVMVDIIKRTALPSSHDLKLNKILTNTASVISAGSATL